MRGLNPDRTPWKKKNRNPCVQGWIRSLGFNFTDWFAPFFSVRILTRKVACVEPLYCPGCSKVTTPPEGRMWNREAWAIVGPKQLKINPWNCTSLLWMLGIFLTMVMSTIAGQPRLLALTFLFSSQSPTSCERRRTLLGMTLRRRSEPETWRKQCAAYASNSLASTAASGLLITIFDRKKST